MAASNIECVVGCVMALMFCMRAILCLYLGAVVTRYGVQTVTSFVCLKNRYTTYISLFSESIESARLPSRSMALH